MSSSVEGAREGARQRCCLDGRPAATEVDVGATTTTRPAAAARQNIAEAEHPPETDSLKMQKLKKEKMKKKTMRPACQNIVWCVADLQNRLKRG